MFKKVFSTLLLLVSTFLFTIKISANESNQIKIDYDKQTKTYNLDEFLKFRFIYDDESKTITIKEYQGDKIETLNVSKEDIKISFKTKNSYNITVQGGYHSIYRQNANLNLLNINYDISNEFNYIYDGKVEYTDRYTMDFVLTKLDHKPGISGEDFIITNIDKPYTIEEIMDIADIKAYDDYDGDLTKDITYDAKDYLDNINKTGTYEIIFKVTNSSGVEVSYILKVVILDITPPTINGPDELSYSYTKRIELNDILKEYEVSDNYDDDIKLEISAVDKFENNKPGNYKIKLKAKDSSGNETIKNITINIIDDQKPIIIDEINDIIQINYKDNITNELLLSGLKATDEIDGDITDKIKVIKNNIGNKLDKYKVIYEVSDKAGNKTTHERTYEVISTDIPIFYVSKNLIKIEDINELSIDDLLQIITNYNKIVYKSYEVITNEYEGNENVVGSYKLKAKVIDEFDNTHIIEQTIEVFNRDDFELKTTKNNIYKHVILSSLVFLSIPIIIKVKNRK